MDTVSAKQQVKGMDTVTAAQQVQGMDSVTATQQVKDMDTVSATQKVQDMDTVSATQQVQEMDSVSSTTGAGYGQCQRHNRCRNRHIVSKKKCIDYGYSISNTPCTEYVCTQC